MDCLNFRHLNFQKWSEHGVFCTFWLENVLRATAACALVRLLLVPPNPQIIGKTERFATFLTFRAPVSSFFWLFPFLSATLVFYSSLLCFSSFHIVGSLTSKFPSKIFTFYTFMVSYFTLIHWAQWRRWRSHFCQQVYMFEGLSPGD